MFFQSETVFNAFLLFFNSQWTGRHDTMNFLLETYTLWCFLENFWSGPFRDRNDGHQVNEDLATSRGKAAFTQVVILRYPFHKYFKKLQDHNQTLRCAHLLFMPQDQFKSSAKGTKFKLITLMKNIVIVVAKTYSYRFFLGYKNRNFRELRFQNANFSFQIHAAHIQLGVFLCNTHSCSP